MKKLGNLKELVLRNKKKVIGGTLVVVGVVGGVLIVKYLSGTGENAVAETIEVLVEGSEEALEGLEGITVTTI